MAKKIVDYEKIPFLNCCKFCNVFSINSLHILIAKLKLLSEIANKKIV